MKKLLVLFGALAVAAGAVADLKQALTDALEDERKAEAFYTATMGKFGAQRPFSNIVRAEQIHIRLVTDLMTKYGYAIPTNTLQRMERETAEQHAIRMAVPATFLDSVRKAAELERLQGPFYDKLFTSELPNDVKTTFEKLKTDSLERHLPAFERYLKRWGVKRWSRQPRPVQNNQPRAGGERPPSK